MPFYPGSIDIAHLYSDNTCIRDNGHCKQCKPHRWFRRACIWNHSDYKLFYTVLLTMNNHWSLSIFSAAITGACLGFCCLIIIRPEFLWETLAPLGLGGALAALAVLSRSHFF